VYEGSFGTKVNGSAFYQIKQTGEDNLDLLKAACLLITGREAYPMKADSADSYQLSLRSKADIQKVVDFFSSPDNPSRVSGFTGAERYLTISSITHN
jgi:hypothetical protein